MTDPRRLDELLRAEEGDPGCGAGEDILDAYVEPELAGENPARVYPGTAIHLRSCRGCQADHAGCSKPLAVLPAWSPSSPASVRTLPATECCVAESDRTSHESCDRRMARPGLEPGTPRFSDRCSEHSNRPELPANEPVAALRRGGQVSGN